MIDWVDGVVADLCSSIDYGLTEAAITAPVGPKFLRITDIVGSHLIWNAVPHVKADEKATARYALHDGDIVIARTGATTGESAYIKNPPPAVFASYLVRLKTKPDIEPKYLAYWLKSPSFRTYIHGVLGEKSAQPNASAATMTKAPIRYPKLKVDQSAIANVLSSLDDKIDLNRRMNETLDGMAQAIFQDWFVDFGPIRRKLAGASDPKAILGGLIPDPAKAANLAALFPSSLGVDGLPVGWKTTPLDQIADFLNGLALQKFPAKVGEPSLPVIKIADLRNGVTTKSDRASRDLPPKYVIDDGDYIFSWSGTLMAKVWSEGEGALNQHLFKVTSERFPQWFYAGWVQRHLAGFKKIAASKATTMGHIQRGHLKAAMTVCPDRNGLAAMDRVMCPVWQKMLSNNVENRTLAETRDYLLPRLMSGKISVAVAEPALR